MITFQCLLCASACPTSNLSQFLFISLVLYCTCLLFSALPYLLFTTYSSVLPPHLLKQSWSAHGTFRSLFQHHSSKAPILWHSAFFTVQLSQSYGTTGKTIALTIWTFVGRVMSLLFNTLYRFVIAFLPRSNCLLISWLQSPSTVILEPKRRKSVTTFTFSPSICHEVMGPDAMILVYLIFSFKPALSLSSSTSSRDSLVPLCFLPLEWYHPHIWGCWCFSRLSWFQLVTHPAWHLSWCTQHIGWTNRVTADRPVVLLSQSWTNQLFHVGSHNTLAQTKGFSLELLHFLDICLGFSTFKSFSAVIFPIKYFIWIMSLTLLTTVLVILKILAKTFCLSYGFVLLVLFFMTMVWSEF